MRWKKLFILIPVGILAVLLFGFLGGQIVKLLWNALLPPLFGWPLITFWQGLGLLALCRILFGGLGGRGCSRSDARQRLSDRVSERMTERLAERMEAMTPEERERFRQRIRTRLGFDPPAGETKT